MVNRIKTSDLIAAATLNVKQASTNIDTSNVEFQPANQVTAVTVDVVDDFPIPDDSLIQKEFQPANQVTAVTVDVINDFPIPDDSLLDEPVFEDASIGGIKVEVINDFPLDEILKEMENNAGNPTQPEIVPTGPQFQTFDDEGFRRLIQDLEAFPENFDDLNLQTFEKPTRDTEILAAGKNLTSIDKVLFGPKLSEFIKKPNEPRRERFTTDALRGRSGKYWTTDELDKNFHYIDDNPTIEDFGPFRILVTDPVNEPGGSFGRIMHRVALRANKRRFTIGEGLIGPFNRNFWKSYIDGSPYEVVVSEGKEKELSFLPTIKNNASFPDHVHTLPTPFDIEEQEDLFLPPGPLVSSIVLDYNFYIKDYEEGIAQQGVMESTLPNIYIFGCVLNNDNPSRELNKFITLDDTLETSEQVFANSQARRKFDIKEHPIGQYFDLFGRQYQKAIENGAVERISKKFSNILVPSAKVELLDAFNDKSEMFPMFTNIRFGTDKKTTITEMLSESNFIDQVMIYITNKHLANESEIYNAEVGLETIVQREGGDKRKIVEFSERSSRMWDFSQILDDITENPPVLDEENAAFLSDYSSELQNRSAAQFRFYNSLMRIIFQGNFHSVIKEKFRTLDEMLDGKEAYSETVMYRIAKHENGPSGRLIQSIWVPNSNKLDVLNYIDTQLKYNKRYTYKVWAYQLVIGSRYKFTDLDTDSFEEYATFKAHLEPSIKIIETPYTETTIRVVDKPPVPPDIDIVPYKGRDKEMLFLFRSNVGDYDADPIVLLDSDEQRIQETRESQRKGPNDKITYGADDHPAIYQMFRIDEKPKSYQDFRNKLRKDVRTDIDLETIQSATSAGYVDKLVPNKKYYYVFRVVDIHGQISNPTPVWEVEIINENGLIYPLIRVVDFEKEHHLTTKPAKRFIQVVPSVLQSLINTEKSGYEEASTAEDVKSKIHLGVAEDAVWGKKFKLRLTSRSTGKKIDFNFTFDNKNDEKV